MKRLLLLLSLLLTTQTFAQFSDTVFCDFGGTGDIEYVLHYNQQQCYDSCSGSYYIEILSPNTTVYGITGPYGYFNATIEDTSLCVGDYTLVMENTATAGMCTEVFSIDSLMPFNHVLTPHNVSATGLCDGWAELALTGGIQPYDIDWYDQSQTLIPWENDTILDSLCAGTYYYTVDYFQPGCCDTCTGTWGNGTGGGLIPFTINEPLSVVVDWTMDEMCPWMCDGMVQVSATGGTGNYVFDIGIQTSANGSFSGLCPGSYTVTVTDDMGNTGSANFDIYPAIEPIMNYSVSPESCAGSCDGMIALQDLSASIIEYSIDGGATWSTDMTYPNLCAGTYDVWGLNYNGCVIFLDYLTVAPGNSPVISNVDYTAESSAGANDACITAVSVSGGTPPYTYSIDGQAVFSFPSCGLSSGTHNVCVTDQNGCVTCEIVIIVNCTLQATVSTNDVSCAGSCDGIATLSISGNSGSTTIEWYDNQQNLIGSSPTIGNLCPGQGNYVVTDEAGCQAVGAYNINDATPISVMVTTEHQGCNYPCTGVAVATATGGSGMFEYSLDGVNWSGSGTFTDLCPGTYIMYVRDANGCTEYYTFIIDQVEALDVTTTLITDYATPTSCTGAIDSNPSGGVTPYTYVWTDCLTQATVGTGSSAVYLCPGEYSVIVTDANGCSVTSSCDTIHDVTEIQDVSDLNWKIYPNPAVSEITITTDFEEGFTLHLINMQGQIMLDRRISNASTTISVPEEQLSEGMYIVELISGEYRVRKRLIIK